MKKWFLLIAISLCLVSVESTYAGKDKTGDETLRKSELVNPGLPATTFPIPFTPTSTSKTANLPVSTGYYFLDSDDPADKAWRPTYAVADTSVEVDFWRKIVQGPRIFPTTFWSDPKNADEGLRFFRNPADGNFFDYTNANVDSTDNAFAGPIPIGFPFYFNGIRYDSFYVSTNGVVSLSNRRYFYNSTGQRVISGGSTNCYDPMSMDWFVASRNTPKTATGLDDPTPDNFGYRFAAMNDNPTNATAGIRSNGGALEAQGNDVNKGAYLAPFWGALTLSQYNPLLLSSDDHSKVWFKRTRNSDSLIIYFVNILFAPGSYALNVGGNGPVSKDTRPGVFNYISASAQVVLTRIDSSVTFNYEKFNGSLRTAPSSQQAMAAMDAFRWHTTAGVTGMARHVNYSSKTGTGDYPWAAGGEYRQSTHFYSRMNQPAGYPHDRLGVKFKQWRNALRVVAIEYRVRKTNPASDMEFTEKINIASSDNYELLAGEPRIGALQPVALIQNMTNDIQGPQGVNFVPQDANFRARFRILNTVNNRIIYNRLVNITQYCLNLNSGIADPACQDDPYNKVRLVTVDAGLNATEVFPLAADVNGIPPYGYVQVSFPPFEPNEFVDNHIGRHRAYIIVDPTNPITQEKYLDEWPFDDTTKINLFVMRRLDKFADNATEFHYVENQNMPSVLKWCNINAIVDDGDQKCYNPPSPRGEFFSQNNENIALNSPVIAMDRKTLEGGEPTAPLKGDEIRSFPIDLRGQKGAVISLSVQRGAKKDNWQRGYSDQQLVGPEQRAINNSTLTSQYTGGGTPDKIIVEMLKPSPNGVSEITNMYTTADQTKWRTHYTSTGAAITDNPALSVYGGGGYIVGFSENNYNTPLNAANGLRANAYDDGFDFEFQKFFVPIPDTVINWPNEGAKNFRFRVRVEATNSQLDPAVSDDNDDFYIDNIRVLFPTKVTDVEVTGVKILWPYTIAPASQATEIPVRVKLSNNTNINAPTFTVKVKIFRGATTSGKPIYCRTVQVPNLTARKFYEVIMPSWNARKTGPGTYRMQSMVLLPGGDSESSNDTTFSDVTLQFGDYFTYERMGAKNDVPEAGGITGVGMNINGISANTAVTSNYTGNVGASSSGQIAMKFELLNPDTIYGYQANFGTLIQSPEAISFALYTSAGKTPSQELTSTTIYRTRGISDGDNKIVLDEYNSYMLPTPIALNKGVYWMAVGQLSKVGFDLAGSKDRMAMRVMDVIATTPPTSSALLIDKNLRIRVGNNLENNNLFCYENVRNSSSWTEFMPNSANPAYGHNSHEGQPLINFQLNAAKTMTRGTWMPLIRPFFGPKEFGTSSTDESCPDDNWVPVQLSAFDGASRNGGIDLWWETSSEQNNYGFYLERRLDGEGETAWKSISFLKGAGNSSITRRYAHTDKNVKANSTYQYRLRQVDADGEQFCTTSDIRTLTYVDNSVVLEQNAPNPVSVATDIRFTLPTTDNVKLEVVDIFGNTVKTLFEGELGASSHTMSWDVTNNSGMKVANGTYVYRLSVGNSVFSKKMQVIK